MIVAQSAGLLHDIRRKHPQHSVHGATVAGRLLADTITDYMQRLNVPNGLQALGYSTADIPALVEGTLPQHRVTKLSPRPASEEDLARMFEEAMSAW